MVAVVVVIVAVYAVYRNSNRHKDITGVTTLDNQVIMNSPSADA